MAGPSKASDALEKFGASFITKLVQDPAQVPALCTFSGYLGRGLSPDVIRLYLTVELDEYLEFARSGVRSCHSLGKEELDGVMVWLDPEISVTYTWSELMPAPKGAGDTDEAPTEQVALQTKWHSHAAFAFEYPPPVSKRDRPSWREWIRKHFPVKPGQHRRHIVSYRYIRSLARWLDAEDLRELGYDPDEYGSLDAARWAWILDRLNDPDNFWRGDGWWNSWLGRWMRVYEPFNWDFPTEEEAREEAELRAEEEEHRAQLREEAAREERARLERERLEQERLDRERLERERLERERLERERLERERLERERLERERLERERLERERRERERQRLERERIERERRERERERRG